MVGGRRRVLLVEDQEAVRHSLERALDFSGYEVTAVATAHDAQQAMFAQQIDVVVSDVSLYGGMDGLTLAGWVRVHHASMPILLISGVSKMQMPERLRGDKNVRTLAKPFGMGLLLNTLAELMHQAPTPVLSSVG